MGLSSSRATRTAGRMEDDSPEVAREESAYDGSDDTDSESQGNATGDSNTVSSNAAAAAHLPPVTITLRTMAGAGHEIAISPSETVMALKRAAAPMLGLQQYQVQLALDTEVFKNSRILADYGVVDGTELTLVVTAGVPDFAEDWGHEPDLPQKLLDFADKHGHAHPDWLDGEALGIWEMLRNARQKREDSRRALNSWGHFLEMKVAGEKVGTIRTKPGKKVDVDLTGFIFNNNGDTCIHQLILAADTTIVADVSDGVPGRGRAINKHVSFHAPTEEGTYMLWRGNDLQYSMRDAHRNFRNAYPDGAKPPLNNFPDNFVGWLVVSHEDA